MQIENAKEWRQKYQLNRDDNITIWRYLSLEKWLSMLTTQKMVFSKLAEFSDKNEVEYLINILTKDNKKQLGKSLVDHIAHLKHDYYAVCWNAKEGECRSLWYAYTGNARLGVAIKSSVKSFCSSVQFTKTLPNCYKVAYGVITEDPENLQMDEISLCCKSIAYESENEIRFLLNNSTARLSGFDSNPNMPLVFSPPEEQPRFIQFDCDLNKLTEGFMISPFASEWQKEAILETTRKLAPEIMDKYIKSSINEHNS